MDYSNSVTHDLVQMFSYSKYSLLVLPVVGSKHATFKRLHLEAPFNQTPYSLRHVSFSDEYYYLGEDRWYNTVKSFRTWS